MKNKKVLIVCILAIVIVAIGIAIGVNVSASNKYATAMELIEEYKGDFDSNDELDSKQAVYDSFVGDSTLNGYYGNNDSFDKSYDSTKEYFEGEIEKLEVEIVAAKAKIEQTQDDEADIQESLETEIDDSENTKTEDVQTSDEENASSNTSSSNTKDESVTPSNETSSNEQQTSNNTESTNNSSSSSSSSTTTSSSYDVVSAGVTWHCPAELVKLAPSKGWFCIELPNGNMCWATNDYTETKPPYWECEAGPDGVPISGTVYINGELVQ